jgi:hypothetical protein
MMYVGHDFIILFVYGKVNDMSKAMGSETDCPLWCSLNNEQNIQNSGFP